MENINNRFSNCLISTRENIGLEREIEQIITIIFNGYFMVMLNHRLWFNECREIQCHTGKPCGDKDL